jgi:hypothetical protein
MRSQPGFRQVSCDAVVSHEDSGFRLSATVQGLSGVLWCCVLCSARVGVDNIRVWEETTLAAANRIEEKRRKYDEQVGQPTDRPCVVMRMQRFGAALWHPWGFAGYLPSPAPGLLTAWAGGAHLLQRMVARSWQHQKIYITR